jgi:hypothetical protein
MSRNVLILSRETTRKETCKTKQNASENVMNNVERVPRLLSKLLAYLSDKECLHGLHLIIFIKAGDLYGELS